MRKICKHGVLILSLLLLMLLFPSTVVATESVVVSETDVFSSVQVSYLNNDYSGHYLKNHYDILTAEAGLLSTLGDTIKWKITPLGNNTYTISSVSDPSLYLSDSEIEGVSLRTITGSSVPNRCRWYIETVVGGGCIIQNVSTGKYLYEGPGGISTVTSVGTIGSLNSKKCVWGIADSMSYYGVGSSYTHPELPADYEFKTFYMFAGDRVKPTLKDEYSNAMWASADKFTFTGYDSGYVSFNASTGAFTAAPSTELYSTTITAVHKVTGRQTTFTMVINPKAVLVGVDSAGHDHATVMDEIDANLLNCGYSDVDIYTGSFTNFQVIQLMDQDTNNIFVIRTHGGVLSWGGTEILTDEANLDFCTSNGAIKYKDLTNMKLIIFGGCQTAYGGEGANNLPTVAVEQGAKTAIGFQEEIICTASNAWTKELFELLDEGISVGIACQTLNECEYYQNNGLSSCTICGDEGTVLN